MKRVLRIIICLALLVGVVTLAPEAFTDASDARVDFNTKTDTSPLPVYIEKGILKVDPFHQLDREGVGGLMKGAVEAGRKTNPDIEIGICGEHGGEPSSVEFCHLAGLNYVSCSPYRVPIARLAAAQAKVNNK